MILALAPVNFHHHRESNIMSEEIRFSRRRLVASSAALAGIAAAGMEPDSRIAYWDIVLPTG